MLCLNWIGEDGVVSYCFYSVGRYERIPLAIMPEWSMMNAETGWKTGMALRSRRTAWRTVSGMTGAET